jgi:hypothetical protein
MQGGQIAIIVLAIFLFIKEGAIFYVCSVVLANDTRAFVLGFTGFTVFLEIYNIGFTIYSLVIGFKGYDSVQRYVYIGLTSASGLMYILHMIIWLTCRPKSDQYQDHTAEMVFDIIFAVTEVYAILLNLFISLNILVWITGLLVTPAAKGDVQMLFQTPDNKLYLVSKAEAQEPAYQPPFMNGQMEAYQPTLLRGQQQEASYITVPEANYGGLSVYTN